MQIMLKCTLKGLAQKMTHGKSIDRTAVLSIYIDK